MLIPPAFPYTAGWAVQLKKKHVEGFAAKKPDPTSETMVIGKICWYYVFYCFPS